MRRSGSDPRTRGDRPSADWGEVCAGALFLTLAMHPLPVGADPYPIVVLQALDKVAARVSPLEVEVGSTIDFGTLRITARHCDKRPPEETPESAAFLEIVEVRPEDEPVVYFTGWMFASSPALSALEHSVYDVWVIDCKNASSAPAGTSQ